ncbi:hypothetical protein NCCP2495_14590 [Dietzia sp. NCCP-2495]|nr:hypothetical protein NCCP2495_14590 [Dietzia sp. NCCP-2495]
MRDHLLVQLRSVTAMWWCPPLRDRAHAVRVLAVQVSAGWVSAGWVLSVLVLAVWGVVVVPSVTPDPDGDAPGPRRPHPV